MEKKEIRLIILDSSARITKECEQLCQAFTDYDFSVYSTKSLADAIAMYEQHACDCLLVNDPGSAYKLKDIAKDIANAQSVKQKPIPVMYLHNKEQHLLNLHYSSQHHLDGEQPLAKLIHAIVDNVEQNRLYRDNEAIIEELTKQALHDPLTGLPNRLHFESSTKRAIANAKRHEHLMALLFIDLDNFKYINDAYGHRVGDFLLELVTTRFQDVLRAGDLLARLGGDEFGVILTKLTNAEDASRVALKLLQSLEEPFNLVNHEMRIAASIGIACYPFPDKSTVTHNEPVTLVKNADIAMYKAKNAGKNNYQYFTEHLNTQHLERLQIENALRLAINYRQLYLVYQPIYDIVDNKIIGAECLLRWQHPELGLIPPDRFIPIAEETGLIIPIGTWIIQQAFQQLFIWRERGLKDFMLTINLSLAQLADPNLLPMIKQLLKKTKIKAQDIEFELTETLLMTQGQEAADNLEQLNALGFRISVDDFGTGYSSLSRLKLMAINTLKIDRSFICDIPEDQEDVMIVKTIISLAKNMKLEVIAEGVENSEQCEFLQANACRYAQGYLFSKPIKADEFIQLVQVPGH